MPAIARGIRPLLLPLAITAWVGFHVIWSWDGAGVSAHAGDRAEAATHSPSSHDPSVDVGDSGPPDGHEGSEGLTLVAAIQESVTTGPGCSAEASVRSYAIVAIAVDITLNRYLDHDPDGRMYALAADVDRIREEERRNAAARADGTMAPAVSHGLQGDAIQPLSVRALPGECLRLVLRNDLPDGEPVSLHLHRSSLRVATSGRPAIATEPSAHIVPGRTVTYEWAIPRDVAQGTHYFHSESRAREQTSHGLFGALIVEPPGSRWLDPLNSEPATGGWQAMIVDPAGPDFREFVIYYHEVGDEDTKLRDRDDGFVPIVDPLTKAYRPGSRALNYRSEPFSNRLALQAAMGAPPDESLAYSSYSFGDPATPIARSYLGDPVKERVVHAGSEVSHVHHVHGGSIRWRRDGAVEPDGFASGLDKDPPIVPALSERTDSQSLGPSESFDIAHECGSGGCQASVGDYLFHCHVAQHYFAGMWGIWRVYGTGQDGRSSTDSLPPLQELPDRSGAVLPAVRSDELLGRTVDPGTGPVEVTPASLRELVESQLPPAGLAEENDASVLDWTLEGRTYLGEPETAEQWPGYVSSAPVQRPPLLFEPETGRLAYPFLRPHLGKRPPFGPGHGPAPYLDPPRDGGHDPPAPGTSGPASLCPFGKRLREERIEAFSVPVPLNAERDLVDPQGQLYALRDQVDDLVADPDRRVPLVIRANAGEDCLDVVLTSRLEDRSGANLHSKVGLHIHFVQFDIQGSDGLDTGFNYEQTVRPYTLAGRPLAAAAERGASVLVLDPGTPTAGPLPPGALVAIGIDAAEGFETRRVVAFDGRRLQLDAPLERSHPLGEIVSTEFVRYRWYPDVQVGTTYFHDHVNALSSWRHGLFGALIVEPPGSTYRDPYDGSELRAGLVADVRTEAPVGLDVTGSFRELVLFVSDGTEINREGRSAGSSVDLRAEPLDGRAGDPARLLDSTLHGDPATPVFEAYVGDPLVVRTLVPATNDIHTLHIDGHPFRIEPWSPWSPRVSTARIGISERYDLVIPAAGGPARRSGDYLYRNGRPFKFREGSWGILRVLDPSRDEGRLMPLPGLPATRPASGPVCPRGAPVRRFDVHAIEVPLLMLAGRAGGVYVLAADRQATLDGDRPPQPLVLRVRVGDCLAVDLTSEMAGGQVSFHTDQLVSDPATSAGITLGWNPAQTTGPDETHSYRFYADPGIGETVSLVTDGADVLDGAARGLYGAVVVAAPDAEFLAPFSGEDVSGASRRDVVVRTASGSYRDIALFLHDMDESLGTHRMPYSTKVRGAAALDYRAATSDPVPGFADPGTPLIEAYAGDPLRIHVLAPVSEQAQVFSIEGHTWPMQPGLTGSALLDSVLIGGLEAITLRIDQAGGPEMLPGDYVYGDHRLPYREAGLWGILRVHGPESQPALLPLEDASERLATSP